MNTVQTVSTSHFAMSHLAGQFVGLLSVDCQVTLLPDSAMEKHANSGVHIHCPYRQKTFKFSVGFLSIPGTRLALKKIKKTSTSLSYIATSVLYQDVKEN